MKYVMSDIHGCYNKYMEMLKLIEFSDNDELYILGDIFDRGEKSLEILDYIVDHSNIHLIKGNHEKMYEEAYESGDYYLWSYNGGNTTRMQLMQRYYGYEESLYKYIRKLPFIKVIDKFILVHAGLYFPNNYEQLTIDELIELQEENICLWDRSSIGNEKTFKDYTVIHGHTPTPCIIDGETDIIHRNGHIYIDCGCCFKGGKLACLRLDDMKEFYI